MEKSIRPTRYLLAAGIFFAMAMLIIMLTGCGKTQASSVTVQPLEVVNGQSVDAWIKDLEENPPRHDPLRSYGFKDPAPWTGWNRFWLAAGIGGQSADAATTIDGLDSGNCREANQLLGEDPEDGLIIGVKLAGLGVAAWLAEYYYDGHPRQQEYRNWIYGTLAVAGAGAAVWNSQQDCK